MLEIGRVGLFAVVVALEDCVGEVYADLWLEFVLGIEDWSEGMG